MVSQTERITAVSVVVSQLNDLAAAFNEQHRALDRAAFRDLCRQLHEPLNAVLKLGIADKSIEQAIRKSFGYERSDPPTPNTKGCITIDLAMVFLSDDPKADSVLELVGYNELHDWVEESQGEIELIARKEVLKPGRIAESSLGPVMPTYYRHEDGSLSDLTPRMYAKFCKAIIEALKLPLQENTPPGDDEQNDAPKPTKVPHTPAADQFQHIRPVVLRYVTRRSEPRKAVLTIAVKLKKEEFKKGEEGIWLSVLNEFKSRFKSADVRKGIESTEHCENVWKAYHKWLKEKYPDLDESAEIDLLYGHL